MTSIPNFQISSVSDNKLSTIFSKELEIFGLKIYATSATSDEDIVHAGKIFAEYLDNDEDGEVDDQEVLASLKNENASLIMFKDEEELETTDLDILDGINGNFQDLYGSETIPNGAALNEFDASLEEILHLISDNGYSKVYPDAFSTKETSLLTEAMDIARGGKFLQIPNSYPSDAWYTYYDETCDYSCQATEYFYWGLTSILGGQDFTGRYESIQDEWELNTREKVQDTDKKLYALLTDKKYSLPTNIPDGDYNITIPDGGLSPIDIENISTSLGSYILVKSPKDFEEAKAASISLGGYLAEFETANEATAVWNEINEILSDLQSDFSDTRASDGGSAAYVWLGGSDGDTTSTQTSSTWNWEWINSSVSISKDREEWGDGSLGKEPDNYLGSQHRLALGLENWPEGFGSPGYGAAGEWNDVDSTNKLWYLVELSSENELSGTNESDTLTSTTADETIDGDSGNDTVVFSGTFSDYTFTRTTSFIKVADQRTAGTTDGTDTLSNVEYIQFSDQTVDESKVDVTKSFTGNFRDYKFYNKGDGNYEIKNSSTGTTDDITGYPSLQFTGEATTSSFKDISAIIDIKGTFDQVTGKETASGGIFRLYNAAFARFPDASGLRYWIDKFSSGVDDERAVASSFIESPEFAERYGANVTNANYVETLYVNVLGRDYDQEGYNYWLGNLNAGIETRYEALLGFAESAENKALFTEMTGFA